MGFRGLADGGPGMKRGTITRARKSSSLLGGEYKHVSPEGGPKPTSECMYNRKAVDAWIRRKSNHWVIGRYETGKLATLRTSGGINGKSYPTGVENHGKSLRIWFILKVKRVRENLGVPDTAKN